MADLDPHTAWGAIAGRDVALATVQMFLERSSAVRVAVLLDDGYDGAAAVVECEPGGPILLTEGEQTYAVPPAVLESVVPLPMNPPRPVPSSALEFDPDEGTVMAPMGAVANLGLAVLELAKVLGGRTVATADFATRDGEPVTIAARDGEPLILALGDHQFEMPVPASE